MVGWSRRNREAEKVEREHRRRLEAMTPEERERYFKATAEAWEQEKPALWGVGITLVFGMLLLLLYATWQPVPKVNTPSPASSGSTRP